MENQQEGYKEASDTPRSDLDVSSDTNTLPPGAQLKALREEQGLSEDDVQRLSRIPYNKLPMLEADDYEGIGNPVFVSGYIRNYAKVVGADASVLVEQFFASQNTPSDELRDMSLGEAVNEGGLKLRWVLALLLLLIVVALAWFSSQRLGGHFSAADMTVPIIEEPVNDEASGLVLHSEPNGLQAATNEGTEVDSQADVGLELEQDLGRGAVVAADTMPNRDAGDSESALVSGALAATSASADEPVERSEPAADPLASQLNEADAADSQLDFIFSDECWLEVKDASGKRLFAELKAKGDNLRLLGQAPFSIVLGNANAVSLTIDGRIVDVPRSSVAKLARLKVQ
ncbi:helix-turn-helix domain-containing protein [Agaribacterium sp. ZY112]|uniref:helix-turn-helix domain-containing protein n=1 Tax=Agaribacterium sp. ZY112 TaxID=3233574 RepID=UPI0035261678